MTRVTRGDRIIRHGDRIAFARAQRRERKLPEWSWGTVVGLYPQNNAVRVEWTEGGHSIFSVRDARIREVT